jgi:hypothetical protein
VVGALASVHASKAHLAGAQPPAAHAHAHGHGHTHGSKDAESGLAISDNSEPADEGGECLPLRLPACLPISLPLSCPGQRACHHCALTHAWCRTRPASPPLPPPCRHVRCARRGVQHPDQAQARPLPDCGHLPHGGRHHLPLRCPPARPPACLPACLPGCLGLG